MLAASPTRKVFCTAWLCLQSVRVHPRGLCPQHSSRRQGAAPPTQPPAKSESPMSLSHPHSLVRLLGQGPFLLRPHSSPSPCPVLCSLCLLTLVLVCILSFADGALHSLDGLVRVIQYGSHWSLCPLAPWCAAAAPCRSVRSLLDPLVASLRGIASSPELSTACQQPEVIMQVGGG